MKSLFLMSKRTLSSQSKRKKIRISGFRARLKTKKGQEILNNRRRKKRRRLA